MLFCGAQAGGCEGKLVVVCRHRWVEEVHHRGQSNSMYLEQFDDKNHSINPELAKIFIVEVIYNR